jgi:hypothetical protein
MRPNLTGPEIARWIEFTAAAVYNVSGPL